MRKRLVTGALAALMAVSGIVTADGTVYAANNTVVCTPSNIESKISEIKADNKVEKILLLQPGEYSAIAIDKPNVTVRSQDPDNPAVFKGTVIPQKSTLPKKERDKLRSSMIEITASNVKVENVEITGLKINKPGETVPIGIEVTNSADNITINNCHIYDMGCEYTPDTYEKTKFNAHGIIVSGDDLDDPCSNINISGCNLHDLVLGNSEALVLNGNVDGFTISGNTVHDCDNIGIDVIGYENICVDDEPVPEESDDRARNGSVINNHVYNISSGDNLTYRKSVKKKPDPCAGGIYVDGGHDVTISNNYVGNSDIGIELASEHLGGTTRKITVTNNILVNNNSLGGISIGGSDESNGVAVGCEISNNTIYTDSNICFRIQNADSETNVITKNVFIADGKNAVTFKNEFELTNNEIKDNYVIKSDKSFAENKTFKLKDKSINIEKRVFEFSWSGADISGYGAQAVSEEPETEEPVVTTEEPATEETVVTTEEPATEETVVTTEEPATEEPVVTTEEPATEEPVVTTEEPATEEPATEEPVVTTEEPVTEGEVDESEPDWNVEGDKSVYTVKYDDDEEGYIIEYKKKHSENWEPVVLNFENVDLSEYSKVNITVVPSRKNMNLGITNMDEDDPIFYRDHWSKKGKFSSTKKQTVTIKLDEENVKGFYLYLDATSGDKVDKKSKYTFKITDVDFE